MLQIPPHLKYVATLPCKMLVVVRTCRDSDGASPNAADASDSRDDDDDHTLRRKHDVTMFEMTSRFTASGPQGVAQTSIARREADDGKSGM